MPGEIKKAFFLLLGGFVYSIYRSGLFMEGKVPKVGIANPVYVVHYCEVD